MGYRPATQGDVGRGSPGQRRVALPRAPQAGARRLDYVGVENERARAAREILLADPCRPSPSRPGGGTLAPPVLGDHARPAPEGDLICSGAVGSMPFGHAFAPSSL